MAAHAGMHAHARRRWRRRQRPAGRRRCRARVRAWAWAWAWPRFPLSGLILFESGQLVQTQQRSTQILLSSVVKRNFTSNFSDKQAQSHFLVALEDLVEHEQCHQNRCGIG